MIDDCSPAGANGKPRSKWELLGQAMLCGNREAWNDFCAATWISLYYFAKRKGLQHADAEDVANETLFNLAKCFGKKKCLDSPEKYFWTVAHNTLNQFFKSRKKGHLVQVEPGKIDIADDSLGTNVDHTLIREDTARELVDLIRQLPDQQQRVVRLRYLEEKKYREIAEELALGDGTVKSYLHLAREALRPLISARNETSISDKR